MATVEGQDLAAPASTPGAAARRQPPGLRPGRLHQVRAGVRRPAPRPRRSLSCRRAAQPPGRNWTWRRCARPGISWSSAWLTTTATQSGPRWPAARTGAAMLGEMRSVPLLPRSARHRAVLDAAPPDQARGTGPGPAGGRAAAGWPAAPADGGPGDRGRIPGPPAAPVPAAPWPGAPPGPASQARSRPVYEPIASARGMQAFLLRHGLVVAHRQARDVRRARPAGPSWCWPHAGWWHGCPLAAWPAIMTSSATSCASPRTSTPACCRSVATDRRVSGIDVTPRRWRVRGPARRV